MTPISASPIRLLREVDDLRETYDRLTEKFYYLHDTHKEEYDTRSGPLSEAEAEKITRARAELFQLSWLIGETCKRLGAHIALGLTEDEWWQRLYSHLGDDDAAVWMRDAFEAKRRELVDYDELCNGPPRDPRIRVEEFLGDKNDDINEDGWLLPDVGVLRLHRRKPPSFPLEVFDARWADWITATARSAACPVDYAAAPLLASASAMIGHARWASANSNWSEPPHLWCASVGDSGDGKSPGADGLFRHVIPEMERRMSADFPDRLMEARAAMEAEKAKTEAWKEEVRKALKAGTAPPPPPSGNVPEEPIAPRLILNDATIERVAQLLARAAPKGVLMSRDEIAGFLLGMNAYNEGARAFWIEAYGGRPYSVDRIKHAEPIRIPRLAVAWFGGIQPARLVQVMREADDGLLARFTWFWPEPVLFKVSRSGADVDWAIGAFEKLRLLDLCPGDCGPRPIMVQLEPAAVEQMEIFGRLLQDQKEMAGGLMCSSIGKGRGLALRLSLVLAYLDWCASDGYDAPPASITRPSFLRAAKFVFEYAMPMAERTFGDAACPQKDRNAATLARWIAKTLPKEVHVRRLQREDRLPGLRSAEDIHAACRVLVDASWLEPAPGRGGQQRGREAYPVSLLLNHALKRWPQ